MNISILGLNIKKIREKKGISAAELSKLSHIGASTVSQIETGKRQTLQASTIEKIANALEVPTDELFGIEDNKEYVVEDMNELLHVILESDEITLDGIDMTKEEKEFFLKSSKVILDSIRFNRK